MGESGVVREEKELGKRINAVESSFERRGHCNQNGCNVESGKIGQVCRRRDKRSVHPGPDQMANAKAEGDSQRKSWGYL